MKSRCQKIQNLLAERGAAALRDEPDAEAHVADCDACFALLESIDQLDEALRQLPAHDPPQSVVDELLAAPELSVAPPAAAPAPARIVDLGRWKARLSSAARSPALRAAAALVLVVGGAWLVLPAQKRAPWVDATPASMTLNQRQDVAAGTPGPEERNARKEELRRARLKALGYLGNDEDARRRTRLEEGEQLRKQIEDGNDLEEIVVTSESPLLDESHAALRRGLGDAELDNLPATQDPSSVLQHDGRTLVDRIQVGGNESGQQSPFADSGESGAEEAYRSSGAELSYLEAAADSMIYGGFEGNAAGQSKDDEKKEAANGARKAGRLAAQIDSSSATAFLVERERVDGLEFEPARGYWANTYVPGDPRLRVLASRLAGWDRTELAPSGGAAPTLHERSMRPLYTAGEARGAALSLQLDSDRVAARGPQRTLLRVGLTATERHGARRTAANLSLVLDLRGPLETETASALRALLLSFAAAREPGDRFELWLPGREQPIVAAADFRRGFIATSFDELLENPESPHSQGSPDSAALPATLKSAVAATLGGDDPSGVLGSSGVILVTTGSLAQELPELERIAHKSALGGIPINAVGLGTSASPQELERLVLAGQGQRRWLEAASEATGLVDETLEFAGRAVARAARLNIRLAPGVRLVEVIGSKRLDAHAAQRVRSSEQSLDQRLARNLGITADRGEDEDGIQIVIPSLYSGDRHAILLDVVTPGPGPVAEVSLKYKDLVRLTNAESRVLLALGDDDRAGGELQLEVLRGLLAEDLATALERAGDALAAGDAATAITALDDHLRLLAGLAVERPELLRDEVLDADRALLAGYVAVLQSSAARDPGVRPRLVDSLRYASLLKTHAPWPGP